MLCCDRGSADACPDADDSDTDACVQAFLHGTGSDQSGSCLPDSIWPDQRKLSCHGTAAVSGRGSLYGYGQRKEIVK